jgi:methylated-DNA-[protein]-cysteine S-methyltransferase
MPDARTMRTHTTIDSPLGPLTLVNTDGVLSGLYMDGQRYRPAPGVQKQPHVRDPGPVYLLWD